MGHNRRQLAEHIVPLSEANSFDDAKSEWVVVRFEWHEESGNCPCGHYIKEFCYIRNLLNGNETYVGNVCVNKFMGIDTGNVFDGLRRIKNDIYANANEDLIEYAYSQGYLYGDKEYDFLMSTKRKRKLSEPQLEWKRKINRRILKGIVVSGK